MGGFTYEKIVYKIIDFLFKCILRLYRKFINDKFKVVDDISSTYTSLMPKENIDISNYESAIILRFHLNRKLKTLH